MSKTRKDREGNIRLRADGRWEVRVTIGIDYATGEERRISRYAKTQEEAIKLLHELSFIRDHTPNNFQSVTVSEWLPFCLETYMRPTLKQSTYLSYESYIRVHLNPALGNIQLKELTPRILQQYYNYKAETEKLSPKTIVNLNLFLHKALSFAVAEGYINSNPADGVNLPRGSKPQIVILTRDEQARLMQCSYQHRYGVFVRLRRTLNRLNKMKRPLQPGEPTTEIVIQTPKSQNSIRAIPLLPVVLQELQGWQYVQQKDAELAGDQYNASGYIVTNPLGGIIEPRTFKDYYNQLLQASGLRHFTFHALRHTFASRAMEQGMDPKTLSEIMGHYSVSFTLDTYAHVLDGHKQEAVALLGDLFTAQPQSAVYPLVVTTEDDGLLLFDLIDFPDINAEAFNIAEGIASIKEQAQEAILTLPVPPVPTPVEHILLTANQFIVQIDV